MPTFYDGSAELSGRTIVGNAAHGLEFDVPAVAIIETEEWQIDLEAINVALAHAHPEIPLSPSAFSTPSSSALSTPANDSLPRPPGPFPNQETRRARRNRRNPDHIPRPRNAFIFFRTEYVRDSQNVAQDQSEFSKDAAVVWNRMPDDQKRPFREKARREKEEHSGQYPGYAYVPKTGGGKGKGKGKGPVIPESGGPSNSLASRSKLSQRRQVKSCNLPSECISQMGIFSLSEVPLGASHSDAVVAVQPSAGCTAGVDFMPASSDIFGFDPLITAQEQGMYERSLFDTSTLLQSAQFDGLYYESFPEQLQYQVDFPEQATTIPDIPYGPEYLDSTSQYYPCYGDGPGAPWYGPPQDLYPQFYTASSRYPLAGYQNTAFERLIKVGPSEAVVDEALVGNPAESYFDWDKKFHTQQ